ncbi:MAG: ABC transporter substrate-binding protein [Lautropia sp.]
MMLNRCVRLLLAAVLCLSSGILVAQEIRIGVVASLTGPAAGFGREYVDGFEAYVRDWNRRGGAGGARIVLDVLDDETSPVGAVTAFRRLADRTDVAVVWLAISSNSALAIKPLSTEYGIPILTSGAVDALGIPAAPYFFKVMPAAKDFVYAMLEWARGKEIKRIAAILPSDAYGQAEAQHFRELVPKFGMELVASESFANSDTSMTSQLIKIRNAKPGLIYSGATGGPAVLIYKAYKQIGINAPIALSTGALNKSFFDATGPSAEGLLTPTLLGALGPQVGGAAAKIFGEMTSVLARSGTIYNAFGWDHGVITEAAMKQGRTRQQIRQGLEQLKDLPTIGGPVAYSAENHTGLDHRGIGMARFAGSRFEPLTDR